jgi:hypothetical protein
MSLHHTKRHVNPVDLAALQRIIPPATIREILDACHRHTERFRKICLDQIVWLMIAMNIWTNRSIEEVYHEITGTIMAPVTPQLLRPNSGAISYRRHELGAAPMVALFHRICQPLGNAKTPGAYVCGLHAMAIDGQTLNLCDTPQNSRYFGRPTNKKSPGAFPQARVVSLAECGAHTVIDAGVWPYTTSERIGAHRLLRSVHPGMLVMVDCGLYSFQWITDVQQRQADALARLPKSVAYQPLAMLSDGSQLVRINESNAKGRKTGRFLTLRLITYTLTDKDLPGHNEVYRLVTTLLDPDAAPARELAVSYHERWEIELLSDERETHLHPEQSTMRSKLPVGVLQEIYGWLIAHYLVRRIMNDAARKSGLDPDRLSFVHAVRLIQASLALFQNVSRKRCAEIYEDLLDQIVRFVLPPRRLRVCPRVIRRTHSRFNIRRTEQRSVHLPGKRYRDVIALI